MYDKNKPLIVVSIIDNSNLCGGVDKKDLKNLNINYHYRKDKKVHPNKT